MPHDLEKKALASYLEDHNLKHTRQREAILEVFLEVEGHITGEELHRRVRRKFPAIGYTTVYRTMKLLCEAGLAHERHFGEGEALYENVSTHHDHLICTECGRIIEFENPQIEALQELAAREFGFVIKSHKMEIYGLCEGCAKPKR